MDHVVIESESLRVGVLPAYGARVASLFEKQTGREWISGGGQSANVGEDAVYGEDEAVGWDECFPTLAPWDASETMWGRRLRDHGDLWGRPWTVDAQSAASLTTSLANGQYNFARTLSVTGPQLRASYALENRTATELPYLWALHGLLAVTASDRIVLPNVTSVSATYLSLGGRPADVGSMPWPKAADELPFPLDRVQPRSRNFAGKFHVHAIEERRVLVGHGGDWLAIEWDASLNDLGIWLNYGAWPRPPGGYTIALEPTTASADHLGQALESGQAAWVASGATVTWTIMLTLGGGVS